MRTTALDTSVLPTSISVPPLISEIVTSSFMLLSDSGPVQIAKRLQNWVMAAIRAAIASRCPLSSAPVWAAPRRLSFDSSQSIRHPRSYNSSWFLGRSPSREKVLIRKLSVTGLMAKETTSRASIRCRKGSGCAMPLCKAASLTSLRRSGTSS